jgi:hypothetical protein
MGANCGGRCGFTAVATVLERLRDCCGMVAGWMGVCDAVQKLQKRVLQE